ncbi:HPr-rel-A system PqqD family peptide chaperone [Nocardia miyunensis]|uniref:HPr-rel-A system PqqD family peptide chaperone n=1 Tax=Nocardia miyunensis TaxID=282684 RepID=UPI001471504C|nr:HPr-rel-A system PqqD family peptide chaperone [Nocardia miyunensis]
MWIADAVRPRTACRAEPIERNPLPSRQIAHTNVALQPHAVCRKTTSGLTMLFDRAKGVMYELNETASAIVEVLGPEPMEVDAIVEALCAQFDAPADEITDHVEQFIVDFVEAGMLTAD